jgi:hypothetical protein
VIRGIPPTGVGGWLRYSLRREGRVIRGIPAPDARIVVAEGNGKLRCSSTSPGNTEAPSIPFYYFATASVFDGAGHLAFTATASGEFGKIRDQRAGPGAA